MDWTIACLVELFHWDFSKQHFFKRFHENYEILEFSIRSNKGGIFVEISEYHNGARCGCLHVLEGVNWANIVQPKGVKTGQVFKPSVLGPAIKQVQHTQRPKPNRHPVFFNPW